MNGLGWLKKQGKTVVGEFFADNLVRAMTEQALRESRGHLAAFIFAD